MENVSEIEEVTEFLKKTNIPCFKYNYTLDKECQNYGTLEAILELSSDGKSFSITNRKPNEKTEHIVEADQFKVNEVIAEKQNQFAQKMIEKKSYTR